MHLHLSGAIQILQFGLKLAAYAFSGIFKKLSGLHQVCVYDYAT